MFAQSGTANSARTIASMHECTVIDMLCQFAFDDFLTDDVPPATRWSREPLAFTAKHFASFRDSRVTVLAQGRGRVTTKTP